MADIFGAEFRRVENRDHQGKPALVGVAIRTYDTSVEDLWDAITIPERLSRWFLPLAGDLRPGGRYQLQGNAGGTITSCEPPMALDVTWEFAGAMSWVSLRLEPEGERARLTLEHIAHLEGIGAEHMAQFGPAATGIGWDLALYGLGLHVNDPAAQVDHEEAEAWSLSSEGKAFTRACGEAWAAAHVASGAEPEEARAQAERTIAFYSGE